MTAARIAVLSASSLLLALTADAQCYQCAFSKAASSSAFFGAVTRNGISEVKVYVTGDYSGTYFSQKNLDDAIREWNNQCGGSALPKLTLAWGETPPAGVENPDHPEHQKSLVINYDQEASTEPTFDAQKKLVEGPHPGSNTGNQISLTGLCPTTPPPGGGKWLVDCAGPGSKYLDWRKRGGWNVFLHEFGHAFGLSHDKSTACKGVMIDPLDWTEGYKLTDEHCQLANQLNDTGSVCSAVEPVGDAQACAACRVEVSGTIEGLEGVEMVAVTLKQVGSFVVESTDTIEARSKFSFPNGIPNADYSITVGSPTSQGSSVEKSCGVASGGDGKLTTAGVSDIIIRCQCNEQAPSNASSTCSPPVDDPIFDLPDPAKFDICEEEPSFCDPFLDPWWYLDGPHGTTCWSIPYQLIIINEDGSTDIVFYDYLYCVGFSQTIEMQGPEISLDVSPEILEGSIALTGWANHPAGVGSIFFLVDGQIIAPAALQRGLWRSDACASIGECNPHAGFQAILDFGHLSNGQHTLQIVAVNGGPWPVGTLYERTINVQNDCASTTPPTIQLSGLVAGGTVAGTVPLKAQATSGEGIEQVGFFVDGVRRFTDWTAPYELAWDTLAHADGQHQVRAVAVDRCGLSAGTDPITVTVANANDPPQLALETPTPLLQLSGVASVSGWAVDADAISSVSLRLSTQVLPLASPITWVDRADVCSGSGVADPRCPRVGWQTSFDTTLWPDGDHTFRVVVVDGRGASAEKAITLSIRNAPIAAPTVSTPASKTVVAGDDVSFTVTASGEGPFTYRWQYRSGTSWLSLADGERSGRVTGTATPKLSVADVVMADQASYRCVVENAGGVTASSAASLTVYEQVAPPTVTAGLDQAVTEGDNAYLQVSAQGVEPLTYRWQRWNGAWADLFDDGRVTGTATDMLAIAGAVASDAGSYRAAVSNDGGTTFSGAISLTVDPVPVGTCQETSTTLCFQANRFAVSATVNGGAAWALPFSQEGGFFWAFEPNTVEVAIKILDGTGANGHFWVFHGSLTDRAYSVTVTDTITGASKTYLKEDGHFCGEADTVAFHGSTSAAAMAGFLVPLGPVRVAEETGTPCASSSTLACLLGSRFAVEVLRNGVPQPGVAVTDLSASFGFVTATAPEVVVKIIDGTSVNEHYWLFFGSLTDQDFTVRVTDSATGVDRMYGSPGALCGGADTTAF